MRTGLIRKMGYLLTDAIDKHRRLLKQHSRTHQSGSVMELRHSDLELHKLARQAKDKWWQEKASQMQWLTDTNQLADREMSNEKRDEALKMGQLVYQF
ncbi:unnamed protein product [Parnassius apollo]|uniref:(apollo) hypothetical protein n=1 Tax=Parnassius apollo TaxID=110799 RepID=A0A8S3YC63_PARAO|nr:unnamed protein product [Parnassius apollo]